MGGLCGTCVLWLAIGELCRKCVLWLAIGELCGKCVLWLGNHGLWGIVWEMCTVAGYRGAIGTYGCT